MTRQEMESKINDIFKVIQITREAGQVEYARELDNAFANFDRVANSLDTSREKVLMTYLLKHIDGVSAYCNGHKSQREDVRGRITDIIVYLCLLWGMIDEREDENTRSNSEGISTKEV